MPSQKTSGVTGEIDGSWSLQTSLRLEASSSGGTKTLDVLQNVTAAYKQFTVSGITVTSPSGPDLGECTVRAVAAGDDNVSVFLDDASLTRDP